MTPRIWRSWHPHRTQGSAQRVVLEKAIERGSTGEYNQKLTDGYLPVLVDEVGTLRCLAEQAFYRPLIRFNDPHGMAG